MKNLKCLCVILPFAVLLAVAQSSASQGQGESQTLNTADRAQAAIQAISAEKSPDSVAANTREYFEFQDKKSRRLADAVREYTKRFPQSPYRYQAWLAAAFGEPLFLTGFKPEFNGSPGKENLEVDMDALAAFRNEFHERLIEIIQSQDASDEIRDIAFFGIISRARKDAIARGGTFDIRSLSPIVDNIVGQYPDRRAVPVVRRYANELSKQAPTEASAFLKGLAGIKTLQDELAKNDAKQQSTKLAEDEAIAAKAVDIGHLKFSAIDEREVDLGKMRGKVILVDFWATWCGPCVEEIPRLQEAYSKYHDRGLEVIGIALEDARLNENDSSEKRDAKLAAARSKLVQFTSTKKMPWPQYFDGLGFRTRLTTQYGMNGIPRIFLIDKSGRLQSSNVGEMELFQAIERSLEQ